VKVGMTRADLDKLGLSVNPGPLSSGYTVGPYTVNVVEDRVDEVCVPLRELPSGARVGGKVFDKISKIEVIAKSLQGCGPVQMNVGANVIACHGGGVLLIAAGPPGIVELCAVSPKRASRKAVRSQPDGEESESTWRHPGMDMTFRYPDKWLKVQQKPDGAVLESEILGMIEDRSDNGKDRPSPLTITITVRVGKMLDVMKRDGVQVATMFPGGTEESFEEEGSFSERVTVSGKPGYSIVTGDHNESRTMVFVQINPSSTLEVTCDYVGDGANPKVPMAVQAGACAKVISTLAIKL
jgi:hypothetical protein